MNIIDDYSNIKKDKEGSWSLTHKKYADQISELIFNIVGYNNIICDATAGIGGNTISFCKYFKTIIALEKNTSRYELLKDNIKLFNLTNINIYNDSCLNFINNNYDVFFFDPPWGGYDYKKSKQLSLNLDDIKLCDILNIVKKNSKLCVFKLPSNYNIHEFSNYQYKLFNIHNYIILLF